MHFLKLTYLLTLTFLLTNPSYLYTYLNTYLIIYINTYLLTLTCLFTILSYLSTYLNTYLIICINTYLPPFLTSYQPTDIIPNLHTWRTNNPTIFPLLDITTVELSIEFSKIHKIRLQRYRVCVKNSVYLIK